ncbi:membrane-associated PAP2 superfamily phosphatase [Breoghania corrubedonensis]|uniref:Membrane-associated PAP2 superfamily phosphatase n=1 Tax=Breoghania corrubedonensis TaxID=665038 RepID=A0A2T5VIA6_9HYPH|nr:phosphatase PAP2 family protein [Breoghania corrubedonensis]PTW63492.1 membrane-associated PAP2 superfamily phosphatase [Breoghania corrubedonensis]
MAETPPKSRLWTLAGMLYRGARHALRAGWRHPLPGLLWASALVSAFFLLFPGVDLWVSGLYHHADLGGFPAEQDAFLRRLRGLGPLLVWVIALGSGLVIFLKLVLPERPPLVPLRGPLFLLITLALGPGLMANGILKATSGRPRPRNVELFGGDLPYVPVWRFTDYCQSNCSFVSGEGSSGAWLVAFALALPLTWRRPAAFVAVAIGAMVSLNRVAFGGHFLSDTLLAWCLNGLLIALFYRLFYQRTPAWLTDTALESGFTRLGYWLKDSLDDFLFRLRQEWRAWRNHT